MKIQKDEFGRQIGSKKCSSKRCRTISPEDKKRYFVIKVALSGKRGLLVRQEFICNRCLKKFRRGYSYANGMYLCASCKSKISKTTNHIHVIYTPMGNSSRGGRR